MPPTLVQTEPGVMIAEHLSPQACDAAVGSAESYIHAQTAEWNNTIIVRSNPRRSTARKTHQRHSIAPGPTYIAKKTVAGRSNRV